MIDALVRSIEIKSTKQSLPPPGQKSSIQFKLRQSIIQTHARAINPDFIKALNQPNPPPVIVRKRLYNVPTVKYLSLLVLIKEHILKQLNF